MFGLAQIEIYSFIKRFGQRVDLRVSLLCGGTVRDGHILRRFLHLTVITLGDQITLGCNTGDV